ncbi:MAG: hypothetical protein IJ561_03995 [Ruminococcus sp.]|nr:hypothetical protein [Ruminococcus sp.]
MADISQNKIRLLFFRMIGESSSDTYNDLIARSTNLLTELTAGVSLTDKQAEDCNYAAAANAAYEWAVELAAKEQLVMTESGGVRRGSTSAERLRAAAELRDHAFSAAAGAIKDTRFTFETVGESE